MIERFYPNGEPVVCLRIQDEAWYPDYQAMMYFSLGENDKDVIYNNFVEDFRETFKREPTKTEIEHWKKWAAYLASLPKGE